ncbi:WXG100-like domain-containing protein, partial [Kibdelosporangium philippinense]
AVVVGNNWPEYNAADLQAMASQWRAAGEHVAGVIAQIEAGAAHVERGLTGTAYEAFRGFIAPLIEPGGQLDVLRQVCFALADALEAMLLEGDLLRKIIIILLVILLIELMADAIAAWFTFGTTSATSATRQLATRAQVFTWIRRAITRLVTHCANSVLAQVGVTFFAQLIQYWEGKRDRIDGQHIRAAAINGAVGGAVGFGMGGLGSLAKIGGTPNSWKGAATSFAVNAPANVGWGAATGAAEAAAQDAATGLTGDEVYGAQNGAFNGVKGGLHTSFNPGNKLSITPGDHLNNALNKPFDTPPPRPHRTETDPPRLETGPPEDWDAWGASTTQAILDAGR